MQFLTKTLFSTFAINYLVLFALTFCIHLYLVIIEYQDFEIPQTFKIKGKGTILLIGLLINRNMWFTNSLFPIY